MDASKAVSLALSVAIVLGYAGPNSWAQGGQEDKTHPPGNNGTVKVDGEPWDSTPNNEPHPGCTFEIDFYG